MHRQFSTCSGGLIRLHDRDGEPMNRWRCDVCESLKDPADTRCIVCEFERDIAKGRIPPRPESRVLPCAFPGCSSNAQAGERWCAYHRDTVCPRCLTQLRQPDMPYCASCTAALTAQSTAGWRITGLVLRIAAIVLGIALTALILTYYLYFR